MVVYDVTEPQSYVDIESWLKLASKSRDKGRLDGQPQRDHCVCGGQ